MWRSVLLSATSAVVGAVFGAFLAYLIVTQPATGAFRRVVTAVSGVLAQFGGVPLAFAFIATIGASRSITLAGRGGLRLDIFRARGAFRAPGPVLRFNYLPIPP